MQTMAEIQSSTLTVELRARDMQETYSVLEDHKIKVYKNLLRIYFVSQ